MSERLPRFTNQTHTHTGRCGRTWIPCDSIRSADLGTCQLLPRQKTLLTNEHSFRCNPFRRTRYVRRSICLFALTEVRETDRCTKCQCQVVLRSGRELIADLYIDRLANGHEHHLVRTPTRKSPSKRGGSRSQCHMRGEGARGAARSHRHTRRMGMEKAAAHALLVRAARLVIIPMQRTQETASGIAQLC
jgi:hypothetical protein